MPPNDPPSNNHLLALGTAAVLAVFGAGFVRTQQAAERFEGASRRRQPAAPVTAPKNSADANAPAPAAPVTPAHVTPESAMVATGDAARAEQAANAKTAQPANSKVEQTAMAKVEKPAKPQAEQKPDTTRATAVAEVTVIRPTPAPADTTSAKAPIDSSIGVARDLKDGVYTGWGYSRHGDIESRVEIKNGRIISATITQCLTRYSVYWIAALPPQVVKRQSPEVDVISGATESSNAFYDGIVEALKKAK